MSLSIFTSMTNPEERGDPWKEALNCYNEVADEVIVVGEDWPLKFSWDHIGKTFQEGYDKCSSDWVIRMDIDYFFHQNDIKKLKKALLKFKDYPAIAFPQYQIFTPDRYQIKTRICLAFNKKYYKKIRLNGGGDLTLATLDNKLIEPKKVPNINVPIYQYESTFRTKNLDSISRHAQNKSILSADPGLAQVLETLTSSQQSIETHIDAYNKLCCTTPLTQPELSSVNDLIDTANAANKLMAAYTMDAAKGRVIKASDTSAYNLYFCKEPGIK